MSQTVSDKNNTVLLTGYLFLIPQLLMIYFSWILILNNKDFLPSAYLQNISLNTLGIVITVFMYFSILRSRKFQKLDCLLLVFFLISSLYMFSDAVYWIITGNPVYYMFNVVGNLVYTICPLLMVMIFWNFLGILFRDHPVFFRRMTILMNVFLVIGVLFLLGNVYGKYYYSISPETGIYARGPLYNLYVVIPSVMFFCCFIYILSSRQPAGEKLILLAYPIMPYLDTLIHLGKDTGPSVLTIEVFCATAFFYTNLYVNREREAAVWRQGLTDSQLHTMQLQINPHFLYNTLGSIASLCDSSPEDAQEMIYLLSDYLHDHFSEISKPSVISFQDELAQLKHYLSIECIRFPNIQIHYDIQAEDFDIPVLTLQPLVENAIRHGICKKRKSEGNITIASFETKTRWVVTVTDDGAGFKAYPSPNSSGHIGIQNVRTRLHLLCGGVLKIISRPDEGTTCRITIPK